MEKCVLRHTLSRITRILSLPLDTYRRVLLQASPSHSLHVDLVIRVLWKARKIDMKYLSAENIYLTTLCNQLDISTRNGSGYIYIGARFKSQCNNHRILQIPSTRCNTRQHSLTPVAVYLIANCLDINWLPIISLKK